MIGIGNPLFQRFATLPGVIGEAGALPPAMLGMMAKAGAGGDMGGPSTINLTPPSRYGSRPSIYGGGPMRSAPLDPGVRDAPSAATPENVAAGSAPAAAQLSGGMFGAKAKHKIEWGPLIAMALLGATAGRNPLAAAEMQMIGQGMAYRRKKADEDAQTAQYVQALVANGMDPNMATILAADPQEMAKHVGTRFDAATIDEGSSRYTPNLNGTANVFTAPKTFQNKADVVQMPGSQAVTSPYSSLGVGAPPLGIGAPQSVPGLRSEAEQYAGSLGYQPGTPQYSNALQDFELKANGPTAYGNQSALQAARLAVQQNIARGHDATSAANSQRTYNASIYSTDHRVGNGAGKGGKAPTPSTVIGAIMDKQSRGETLTPAEQNTLRDYRTHFKPQYGGVQIHANEPVAVGPRGEKLVVRNGQWIDSATGKPVK